MYSTRPGLVLDFHGCDETLVDVVIGAVINLGFCLDLLDYLNLSFLKETHSLFIASNTFLGTDMLVNKTIGTNKDLVLQELACAVIETLHQFRLEHKMRSFDSLRGVFSEGGSDIRTQDVKRRITSRFVLKIRIVSKDTFSLKMKIRNTEKFKFLRA